MNKEKTMMINAVAVFCGSQSGENGQFSEQTALLGKLIAQKI